MAGGAIEVLLCIWQLIWILLRHVAVPLHCGWVYYRTKTYLGKSYLSQELPVEWSADGLEFAKRIAKVVLLDIDEKETRQWLMKFNS